MPAAVDNTLTNVNRTANCTIKINGTAISEDMMGNLMDVSVEQSLYLPSMATVRLYSPYLQWFDSSELSISSSLEIAMGAVNSVTTVFKGEITALEFDASPAGMPIVAIQGYDKLHRLHRGRKTKVYTQVTDSDIFSQILSDASLSGTPDSTSQVFDYVLQNNETDWEFLQRRANRIGMEILFDHSAGQAKIRKRPSSSDASATVNWGVELVDLKVRLTGHNQVSGVTVRGWDPKQKAAIVGTSSSSDFNPSLGYSKTGSSATSSFGSATMISVFRDVVDQTEAESMANAIYESMTGQFIQAEGECFGDPTITVGSSLEVKNVATNYSGKYYLTTCIHHFSSRGYFVRFESNGRQTNTLTELTATETPQSNPQRIYGTVIGVVSKVIDSDNKALDGMVQVTYPTLGDNIISNWARLVSPMAGSGRGFFCLPEVNDEVLVAFENGDIHRPYVLGAVWNGTDKPPAKNSEVADDTGIEKRIFKTRVGHIVTFDDKDGEASISIVDKTANNKINIDSEKDVITVQATDAQHTIVVDGKGSKITVTCGSQNVITLDGNSNKISIASGSGGIEITSTGGDVKVSGVNISLEASSNMNVKGLQVSVAADTTAEFKGNAEATVSGGAGKLDLSAEGAKLDGGELTQVSGAIVKLG